MFQATFWAHSSLSLCLCVLCSLAGLAGAQVQDACPLTCSGRPSTTLFGEVSVYRSLGETVQPLTMIAASLLLFPSPVPLGPARQVKEAMADLPQAFLCLNFLFLPTHPGLGLLTVPVDNLRSREDARQAREDSIPC